VSRTSGHLRLLVSRFTGLRRLRLEKAASNLSLLSPLSVLARGYGVVRTGSGRVLKRSRDTAVGEDVNVRLHEGELSCEVKKISEA
jgi:exodeoxyribonuclease VII large subunit